MIAAPADCNRILSLEAHGGRIAWATTAGTAVDAVHLLGVGKDHLLASGDYLYWIDCHTGELHHEFPARRSSLSGYAGPEPKGYGRGLLAGDQVWWPTHEQIFVLDQASGRLARQPIELAGLGLTGGNLVIAGQTLLIAAADRLVALNPWGRVIEERAVAADRGLR